MMARLLQTLMLSAVMVFTIGVNFAWALPDPVLLQGMCDASAIIKIGSQFLVLNDEDQATTYFRLFDFTKGGVATLTPVPELPTEKLQIGSSKAEIDFEGLAQINDVYFAIGSHSRSSKPPYAPRDNRKNLIAFHWLSSSRQSVEVIGSLKNLIPALQAKLKSTPGIGIAEIDSARDPKQEDGGGGLSIEGLAALPNGNLLIGLRSPTNPSVGSSTSRQAIAVELVDPLQSITANHASLGNVYLWQFAGAGIRDLAYDVSRQRVLILSGPPGPGEPFTIWTWDGSAAAQPSQAVNLSKYNSIAKILKDGGAPEGLAIDGARLWIVFDEGRRSVSGKDCKDLASDSPKRTFRAVSIPYSF